MFLQFFHHLFLPNSFPSIRRNIPNITYHIILRFQIFIKIPSFQFIDIFLNSYQQLLLILLNSSLNSLSEKQSIEFIENIEHFSSIFSRYQFLSQMRSYFFLHFFNSNFIIYNSLTQSLISLSRSIQNINFIKNCKSVFHFFNIHKLLFSFNIQILFIQNILNNGF